MTPAPDTMSMAGDVFVENSKVAKAKVKRGGSNYGKKRATHKNALDSKAVEKQKNGM